MCSNGVHKCTNKHWFDIPDFLSFWIGFFVNGGEEVLLSFVALLSLKEKKMKDFE